MSGMTEETAVWLIGIAKGVAVKHCHHRHEFSDLDDAIGYVVLECIRAERRYDPAKGSIEAFLYIRARGAVKDYFRRRDDFDGITRGSRVDGTPERHLSLTELLQPPIARSVIPAIEARIDAKRLLAKIRIPANREAVVNRFIHNRTRLDLTGKFQVTEGRISQRIRAGLNVMAKAAGA